MIGVFTLYLKDSVDNGGFAMSEQDASNLYGTFIAFVFLTPFLGGLLADRVLGYRRSIVIGGLMMAGGYALMAVPSLTMLYWAMFFVVLGNGFFKPNISTLLGNLYNSDTYKKQKDAGYNIFYMGINIGAFISNFIAAAMYNKYGWPAAFLSAAIGMVVGVVVFYIGTRHYKEADVMKPLSPEDMSLTRITGVVFVPALIAGIVGYLLPFTLVKDKMTDGFLFACVPLMVYYFNVWRRATSTERDPILALLSIFVVSIAFWAVFKQNGAMMNTWAQRYTDRSVPAAIQKPLDALYLTESVKGDSIEGKILDSQFRPIVQNGQPLEGKTLPSYLLNMAPQDRPAAGEEIRPFNTNISQSVNPFWVILLTPVVVGFFSSMRRQGTEPSTPDKIAWGLVISALSMILMIAAVNASQNGAVKASMSWFFGTYAVLTVGELFLSPMGLSLVSRLSPPRLTALMMGGWFLATSIGNKMAGVLSSMWDTYDDKRVPFLINIALLGLSAGIIFSMLPWLRRVFHKSK
jgi:POT family proton-dependent oligopeptide transporter